MFLKLFLFISFICPVAQFFINTKLYCIYEEGFILITSNKYFAVFISFTGYYFIYPLNF